MKGQGSSPDRLLRPRTSSCTASLRRRPAMVVNSPGTHRMMSCPTRRIWISTTLGCHSYGRLISPASRGCGFAGLGSRDCQDVAFSSAGLD